MAHYINLLNESGDAANGGEIGPFIKSIKAGNRSVAETGFICRDTLRHSLRAAIILTAASAIEIFLQLPFGYWLPVSTAVMLKPDAGSSLRRAFERIGGTAAGSGLVLLISLFKLPRNGVLLAAIVSAFIALSSRPRSYVVYALFWTVTVVMLLDFENALDVTIALERIVYNISGGALALGATYFLFADRTVTERDTKI